MSSLSVASRVGRVPRVRLAPRSASNEVADASFLATSYGLTPDDWQDDVLESWLGRKRDGRWSAKTCGLAVPRQNGKNGCIEIRELFGMVILGEKFLHTAHEVKTARKAFRRLKHFFGEKANDPAAKYPELNALVVEVRNTNGQEAILLRNGGSVEFIARSKGSGRGFTVDVLVLDEAQELTFEEFEALLFTISSAPLGDPQVIMTGTPPKHGAGDQGEPFRSIREDGERRKDRRLAWTDFGVPDGPMPDIDDRGVWMGTNPAAGGRLGLEQIEQEYRLMRGNPEGFAKERLGWWGNPDRKRGGVIDMNQWRGMTVQAGRPTRGLIVVDVSPNLEWTSVAVASQGPEGRTLLLVDRAAGTGWAVKSIIGLTEELDEVLEVALTPAAQIFFAKLVKAGLDPEKQPGPGAVPLKQLTNTEVGRSCTAFQVGVKGRAYAHVGQEELDDAARNATTRYVGDTQQWDQKDRSVDITPIVSGSVAAHRWALLTAKPDVPPPPPQRAKRRPPPKNSLATAGF